MCTMDHPKFIFHIRWKNQSEYKGWDKDKFIPLSSESLSIYFFGLGFRCLDVDGTGSNISMASSGSLLLLELLVLTVTGKENYFVIT